MGTKLITVLNLHVLSYFKTGGKLKKTNPNQHKPKKTKQPISKQMFGGSFALHLQREDFSHVPVVV